VSVSLFLEMIKTLFSLNFHNFGYSAYSGNRNFVCGFVTLYLIFIAIYGMLVVCTQFSYVVKYNSIGGLYAIKLDLFYIWRLYYQIWISGTYKDMI
jgi:hypothetical protein